MYVNFLSTYTDKKSCHTSTIVQTSIARFVSDSWASCFCLVIQTAFRQLRNGRFSPNLAMKRCPVDESRKTFSKIFIFGVICPQNLKLTIGQTGTSLRAGHGMHCRGILFTPRCSPRPGSFRHPVNFVYDVRLRSYWTSKLPNFRILAYFFHEQLLVAR